jgi:hypothetical protein
MADKVGYVVINALYIVRNLPWIEPKSLEDGQGTL